MTIRNGAYPLLKTLFLPGLVLCLALPIWAEEASKAAPPYIESGTVKIWVEQGKPVTFLDVREPDEFAAGHLRDAITIKYDQVASLANRLPHDQPIVVYCIHSTHRAPAATKTLREMGFANAYVLEGGIVAWEAGGQMILASNPTHPPTILPKTERCRDKPKL